MINPLTDKAQLYAKTSAHCVEIIRDAPVHSNHGYYETVHHVAVSVVQDKLKLDPSPGEHTSIMIILWKCIHSM